MLLGRGTAIAAQFAALLVLARYLDEAQFGLAWMVAIVLGIAGVAADLGMDVLIVQRREIDDRRAANLSYYAGFATMLLVGVLAPLLSMLFGDPAGLEDLMAANPELTRRLPRASLQRRLAFLAREEAYASLLEADSPRAARSAWRSIRYTPLAPKSWLYLALSPWPKLHARIRPHPK